MWCTCVSSLQGTDPVTESRISLADFNILKVIGRGSYAKVLMVELKSYKENLCHESHQERVGDG